MTDPKIKRQRLECGLELVEIQLPYLRSMTAFLSVRSGSRYETAANNGVAHFLEHLVFKGTKSYPSARELAEAVEGIGGYFNAFTDVNNTSYWNRVPLEHWQIGAKTVLEQVFQPLLKEADLERERGVIIEEIRQSNDDPAQHVHDLINGVLFKDNPLQWQILGSEENISSLSHEQFLDYYRRHYRASQAVLVVVGDVANKDYESIIAEVVGQQKTDQSPWAEPVTAPSRREVRLLTKETEQTHFILASSDPIYSNRQPERFAAVVLNAVLGRGMSSRLFLNVREKLGLAYSIYSYAYSIEDVGALSICGGVNTAKLADSLKAIEAELNELRARPVPEDELDRAKQLVAGSFDIQADSPVSLARWYGTDWLLGMRETFDEARRSTLAVTAADVQAAAKRLLNPDRLVMAVIGPQKDDQIFRRFLGQ